MVAVIDDDTDDIEIMRAALKEIDDSLQCACYNDPIQAISDLMARKVSRPEFIFIDINMPKITGDVCIQLIRKDHYYDDSRIAVLSTTVTKEDSKKYLNLGAQFAYEKPVTFAGCVSLLRDILATRTQP